MTTRDKPYRKPRDMDRLRAQALKGDYLKHLGDTEREWVWRSLLKGVRWEQTLTVAGLTEEKAQIRLETVRRWYLQRIDTYKHDKAKEALHPKVVRPIAPPKATPPPRRSLFGLFRK